MATAGAATGRERTQAEDGTTPTVQAHVEKRAERRKRERRFKDRALEAFLTSLLNWHVITALLCAIVGLVLYAQ